MLPSKARSEQQYIPENWKKRKILYTTVISAQQKEGSQYISVRYTRTRVYRRENKGERIFSE